jgi:transcriptional regulator with AAA-type ATPase domain
MISWIQHYKHRREKSKSAQMEQQQVLKSLYIRGPINRLKNNIHRMEVFISHTHTHTHTYVKLTNKKAKQLNLTYFIPLDSPPPPPFSNCI